MLSNVALAARSTLMSNLLEAVTEVKEFIGIFSDRGWLSRLEWVSSDQEEFCRLDRLLISIAVEAGNQPGPEQVGHCSLVDLLKVHHQTQTSDKESLGFLDRLLSSVAVKSGSPPVAEQIWRQAPVPQGYMLPLEQGAIASLLRLAAQSRLEMLHPTMELDLPAYIRFGCVC